MTVETLPLPTRRPALRLPQFRLPKLDFNGWLVVAAVPGYATLATMMTGQRHVEMHFDPSPLVEAGFAVQVHVAAALITFAVGLFLLFGPKGRGLHKPLGWTWVVTMAVTALSSLYITGLNGSQFSAIHGLSAWTILTLPMAVAAVHKRRIAEHRKMMTGMFLGGMLVAGLFSFLPYRTLWGVFFTFA
jgi:uncharacterized membrane protein